MSITTLSGLRSVSRLKIEKSGGVICSFFFHSYYAVAHSHCILFTGVVFTLSSDWWFSIPKPHAFFLFSSLQNNLIIKKKENREMIT